MTVALSDAGVQFADASVQASAAAPQIMPLGASVSGNALTITLGPCALAFRSTTLSNGASTVVQSGSTISVVVTNGTTLGTINGVASRLVVFAFNDSGTMRLGCANMAGGVNLDESGLISPSNSTSSLATAIWSNSGTYPNVPYRIVGYVDSTQATAGTWASAPTLVQGLGGVAGESMQSLGYGQTWQNVTGSRAASTTYYNTTGRPITVAITTTNSGAGVSGMAANGVVNGVNIATSAGNATYTQSSVTFIVPPGASYSSTVSPLSTWMELR